MIELPWPSGYELQLSLKRSQVSNPTKKSHWWTTGRASSPKMLTSYDDMVFMSHTPYFHEARTVPNC